MSVERDDEYLKFVPHSKSYHVVPGAEFQCKLGSHKCRKLSTIDEQDDDVANRKGMMHQILATCAVLLLSAGCGMPIGYSTILLPQLRDSNSTEIPIDLDTGSWIASVHSLATPFGSLISGPLADYLGRRKTLILSVIPLLLGWSTLAIAKSVKVVILARFLCGFATGILGGPGQVYIAETAEPNLRSLLIGAPYVAYSSGILLVYFLGSMMYWRNVAWCANILPLLAMVSIFCIPETPAWLLRNGHERRALQALTFLRGSEISAQKELNDMKQRLAKERVTTRTNENIFRLCCQRVAIKPLVIVIVFSLLQMFSGTFIVIFYAIDMIAEFGVDFDSKKAAIVTAGVRLVCCMLFCVILIFVRRRRIMIVSGIGSGIFCLALSSYQYATFGQPKMSYDVLVGGGCLLGYIIFNTALMVMPGIMIGELFPARIRGRTAGGVFASMNVALFFFAKNFPALQNALKMRGVFLVFGVSSFLLTAFMCMFQPETKGRSLEHIEDYFNGNNWLWFRRDRGYKTVNLQPLQPNKNDRGTDA
ncbi:facilitated trehalose transporter Tret1-2 homolog isoform X2 [Drosophila ficusphila]|uniref:facilitated trehalose transporter Tret1-2 homolog isoform X2 n=1 Tax=Drosophila ficusphila TaxID=30025 RepID=UPI0007E5DE3C|nr:facilitated trehalose transporter Tret1-2 homolog isoform X2 [Drosophila ficusphila]